MKKIRLFAFCIISMVALSLSACNKKEEIVEEPIEEPKEDEIATLKGRVDELEIVVNELINIIDNMKADTEEKFSKISLAKPVEEEFEQVISKKTGDAKLDRFLERYGK